MSDRVFKSIYPYTQEIIGEYPLMADAALEKAISKAAQSFQSWGKISYSEKATLLNKVAFILRRDQEQLATLITWEMGKILSESRGEVEKCAVTAEYYAAHAELFLKDEVLYAGYKKSLVTYQPLGIVLGIMPWNFPFWQVFRYAVPTLMAGNVVLLKHAPNVCGCALALEKLFLEAGLPEGVFTSLIIDTTAVEKIISMDAVQAVTLTGSEKAGTVVASLAGLHVKKSVMELGGSDALLVLSDANIKSAAKIALQSRMLNAGQSCIGAKRFIVLKDIHDEFMQEFLMQLKTLIQGDPFETRTTTGPMARLDLVENLVSQMKKSIALGAQLRLGGEVNGCNFKPALLTNVLESMPAFSEETFGPLASVVVAHDLSEAIRLANASRYGLAASIWTKDAEKGISVAKQLQAGAVYINTLVKSDARLPFGGIKKSGYGRELGRHGMLEFVNAKTIVLEDS